MGENSKIEWTDSTWTPIRARRKDTGKVGWHCEKISPACDHCYAAAMNKRSDGLIGIGTALNYAPDSLAKVDIYIDEKMLMAPLRWKKPRKIFVCSMTDIFGEWVTDEMIDGVFAVMALCPQHTFLVLTKRPERMLAYMGSGDRHTPIIAAMNGGWNVGAAALRWPLPNVWLGVTAENQEWADKRIQLLLQTSAAVRFVSCEPLLGPVWIDRGRGFLTGEAHDNAPYRGTRIDWVITGGESGTGARPSHPDWFRSLRDQCQAAGVAYFHKQNGEWTPVDGQMMYRVGKHHAGRLLDGREWSQFPEDGGGKGK